MAYGLIITHEHGLALVKSGHEYNDPEPFRAVLNYLHTFKGINYRDAGEEREDKEKLYTFFENMRLYTGRFRALPVRPPITGATSKRVLHTDRTSYDIWVNCSASDPVDVTDLAACVKQHGPIYVNFDFDGWDHAWDEIYEVTKSVSHLDHLEYAPYPYPQCIFESPPSSPHLKWMRNHTLFDAGCY